MTELIRELHRPSTERETIPHSKYPRQFQDYQPNRVPKHEDSPFSACGLRFLEPLLVILVGLYSFSKIPELRRNLCLQSLPRQSLELQSKGV